MMLTIQFALVAVILLPCFCLIYAAEHISNETQVSDEALSDISSTDHVFHLATQLKKRT